MVTKEQAMTVRVIHHGQCHRTIGPKGGIRETTEVWRRNGATKVWKTRPNDFQMPIKYGMRDHSYLHNLNNVAFHLPENCPLNDPNWEG